MMFFDMSLLNGLLRVFAAQSVASNYAPEECLAHFSRQLNDPMSASYCREVAGAMKKKPLH